MARYPGPRGRGRSIDSVRAIQLKLRPLRLPRIKSGVATPQHVRGGLSPVPAGEDAQPSFILPRFYGEVRRIAARRGHHPLSQLR